LFTNIYFKGFMEVQNQGKSVLGHVQGALEIGLVGGFVAGVLLGASACVLGTLGFCMAVYAMIKVYNKLKDKYPFLARLLSILTFAIVAALAGGAIFGSGVFLPHMLGLSLSMVCVVKLASSAFMRFLIWMQDLFASKADHGESKHVPQGAPLLEGVPSRAPSA